jgi:uncharacterized protein
MIDLSKIKTIAVVGASNNESKFGNKIVKNLMSRGFEVYPINPREKEIEGLKAFSSIKNLPAVPDLVDLVVRSEVGLGVVKEAIEIGVKNIWIQPGAESDEIVDLLNSHSEINSISLSCIMLR